MRCSSEHSIDYLKFLEIIMKKIILCFDEIITGLRVKNLAVFKKYKLKPDMATFAKCFGGGLPIGITCFNKKIETKISKLNKKFFLEELSFSRSGIYKSWFRNFFIKIKKDAQKINIHINKLSEKLEKGNKQILFIEEY